MTKFGQVGKRLLLNDSTSPVITLHIYFAMFEGCNANYGTWTFASKFHWSMPQSHICSSAKIAECRDAFDI